MCPIFEYACPEGHVAEHLRSFAARDDITTCLCGRQSHRVEISHPHCLPSGVYSYAPNCGNADAFERRLIAIKNGEKVYQKEA